MEKKFPAISIAEMIEVDRLMIEEYQIKLIQMMENAGANLAKFTIDYLNEQKLSNKVLILAGPGNNGGGGLVAARHLHNQGTRLSIKLTGKPENYKGVPAHQLNILKKMGIHQLQSDDLSHYDLIIDAIIGYGLKGNPRDTARKWIEIANQSKLPILSLDIPSGLNGDTGEPGDPCIKAATTLTLALPKHGLLKETARAYVGDVHILDISVPPELYQKLGLQISSFFSGMPSIKIPFP
ncbi:MAG: NAD(P)H-hydrate epimerase [Anaerolineaceae bacterium]|nr:NAD(P)H-hydrate epimerase [Anaerolineaceae bacterium]